jgi:hypothetical protein
MPKIISVKRKMICSLIHRYSFKEGKHFDLHSYGLNTMCEVQAEAKEMFCYGPAKVDCDKIAVLGANVFAALEAALGPLNNMPLLEKKFHIQNFLFWSIMGTILTWIGFIMVLYAEIKAVLIVSSGRCDAPLNPSARLT